MTLTIGLAIMMGTVWLRLHPEQDYIQPFVNAIVCDLAELYMLKANH